ncbi:MAG: CoA transferase [Deltaproteobacteria bacterium]|nr:MAG: CoA transferase [Deltaproteobacteria bacterium]
MTAGATPGPLDGIVVLELGQLVAGPTATMLLGYFGAEVIKVEPPAGDPIRQWRAVDQGTSLWWRSIGRNKKCLAVDLRRKRGQAIVRRLVAVSDVLVENFRPGTLTKWNLDPAELRRLHPRLIVAQVSGFGQSGPYAARPGFASVCEAFGGLRHVTGVPGDPPVRPNLSIGDTLAGLHAALGILLALYQRDAQPAGGAGQVVDTAIYEAVLSLLESVVPECDRLGLVRQPSGTTVTGVAPTGTYRCRDGKQVVIGANSESLFQRLCEAMGELTMAADPRFQSNEGRVAHQVELERVIEAWTQGHSAAEVMALLEAAAVPCSPIYDARDILADPHYRARQQFEPVMVAGEQLLLPAIGPKLDATPGRTVSAGPDLGAHTDEVLGLRLGLSEAEIDELRRAGVVA